ncbi:MAG: hypothetical protein JSR37_08885 [Verrucomicrobia bacterium]|nr:hypothetical protein [Verrucomicrobiota bacterium]
MVSLHKIDPGVTITAANAKDFDISKFSGRVYAVRKEDSVVIKNIFSSFSNFFEFLANAIFNSENTFLQTKNIKKIVADLTTHVASKILRSVESVQTPKPASKSASKPVEHLKGRYYELTDEFLPMNFGVIENLRNLQANKPDAAIEKYIKAELKSLRKLLGKIEQEKEVIGLESEDGQLHKGLQELRKQIDTFYQEAEKAQPTPVRGIKNAGNSCYMNSALQGILGSKHVVKSIKEYDGNFAFMPTLKQFVEAYEANPKNMKTIGDLAATLRRELYHSNLQNMGVERLNAMADADLVLIAIGEALGDKLQYELVSDLDAKNGIHRAEFTNQLVWPHLNTDGTKVSAQAFFNKHCDGVDEEMDADGWRTDKGTVYEATRRYYIAGDKPPEVMVLKVGLVHGVGQNAPFTPYKVSERDAILDASQAFADKTDVKYRLIGVLENHGRFHWTAKSLRDDRWYNCNDGTITELDAQVPESDAAILIYEKI